MPRKTNKKSTEKSNKLTGRRRILWLGGFSVCLVVGLAVSFLVYSSYHQHIEAGQYKVSDTYIGENLGHSLDLKLAAKASYRSSPLKVIRNVESADGLLEKEVGFEVKSDNLNEYGLMVLPTSPKPAHGYPVVVLLHGFASPRDYLTDQAYLSDMNFYAENGFAVIKPDFRGQGLSIGSGLPDSAYFSMVYNTDTMSLISSIKQTDYLDSSNISLWGHSMGAYIALRAAVLSKDVKNVILLAAPVDSLTKMYLTYVPPSDSQDPYALSTRSEVFAKYHTPTENSRFWYDASPINLLNQIKAHIQIHVAVNDQTVPPEFSEDLDAALTKASIPHQYFVYADGRHSLLDDRTPIWQRSLALLQGKPAN
jgi:dipeptidyl aminopeptidase/acylaminoacyl peptidase